MRKIKITPTFLIWSFTLILTHGDEMLPLSLAVLAHEVGHLIAARALGIEIRTITLSILGARMETVGDISYMKEFLLALGGPLAGIILHVSALAIYRAELFSGSAHELMLSLSLISLALSVFNLLPISTLDGGRMLSCILSLLLPLTIAEKGERLLSVCSVFALWLLSVYMILRRAIGLPMLVFSCILFIKLYICDVQTSDLKSF